MAFLNILRFLYFYSFSLPLCYCLTHCSRFVFPLSFPLITPAPLTLQPGLGNVSYSWGALSALLRRRWLLFIIILQLAQLSV